ncbi:MAG: peptide chain release factor N(5)-glutamine methyltransferase [Alphaproteobacteria bacterium]
MSDTVSLRETLAAAAQALDAAGIDDPRREAQVLVGHALGIGREVLLASSARGLAKVERRRVDTLVSRRAAREPAAYILGHREFWSLPLTVTRDTLIPRPDSETVVEAALTAFANAPAPRRVLDLGTGSGCLLLALLSEWPEADGLGVDISAPALEVARTNAVRLGFKDRAGFWEGHWGRELTGEFDLIVANPPYIGDSEAADLAPEITGFEPALALFCGADALACYHAMAPDIARLLGAAGVAVLEIAAGQTAAVADIMTRAGLVEAGRRRDLAGIERCIMLRQAEN